MARAELVKSKAAATVGVKSEPVKTEYVVAAAVAGLDAPTSTSSPEAGAVGARKNDDDDDEDMEEDEDDGASLYSAYRPRSSFPTIHATRG